MALTSYAELQKSVADWLARPDDPLLMPAIADMVAMFEETARDRLRTRFTEKTVSITPPVSSDTIPLPLDYGELREIWVDTSDGRRHFTYQTPVNMDTNLRLINGWPAAYTIEGLNIRFTGKSADSNPDPINLTYLSGLTGLSNTVATNWLLTTYPSTYLWGTLSLAEPYIGDDPRIAVWLAAREERIEAIKLADRQAKYPAGLQIQTDVRNP